MGDFSQASPEAIIWEAFFSPAFIFFFYILHMIILNFFFRRD